MNRLFVIVLSCVLASAAFGAESDPSSTVASAETSAMSTNLATGVQGGSTAPAVETTLGRAPLDSLYFNYFGTFHGGSVGEPLSPQTVNRIGLQQTQPNSFNNINFDSEVGAGYRISKSLSAGVVVPFIFIPVYGQQTVLGDIGVKVTDSQFADIGGAKIYANLIVQAPTSDASKAKGMDWALKSTPSVRYAVPRSNFALGSWTEIKSYVGVDKPGEKTFKLWAGPYVRYSLSDAFALNIEYEMEWRHDKNEAGYLALSNQQTDLQPGFVWNLSSNVMINPYLQIFTTNRVSTDTTAVGAVLSASIL